VVKSTFKLKQTVIIGASLSDYNCPNRFSFFLASRQHLFLAWCSSGDFDCMLPVNYTLMAKPPANFEGHKLDYSRREARLYQRGQRSHWQTSDLPWQLGTKLDARQRRAGAKLLSQILYGEKASLQIIQQLLTMIKDEPEVRLFLTGQAQDEIRHIEVFSAYIQTLQEEVQPPGEALSEMVEGMLSLPTVEEKVIGMHILIEGMALEIFHAAAEQIADPLLQELLRRVSRDESRHIAFGTSFTPRLLARLDQEGFERTAREGGRYINLAIKLVREEEANAHEFGLDLRAIQTRTIQLILRRLQQVGMLDGLKLF